MKKILLIALALISIEGIAQQKMKSTERKEMPQKMMVTPEESAGLQTKRMTLSLDLNPYQQEAIYKINLENAINRKEMMATRKSEKLSRTSEAPSKEAFLKMSNDRLDHKIATKIKMNYILNSEQRTKWEENQVQMASRFNKGMKNNKKFPNNNKSFNEKKS